MRQEVIGTHVRMLVHRLVGNSAEERAARQLSRLPENVDIQTPALIPLATRAKNEADGHVVEEVVGVVNPERIPARRSQPAIQPNGVPLPLLCSQDSARAPLSQRRDRLI